jgi:hypothetical protein
MAGTELMSELKIKLKYPIKVMGAEVAELTFKRLNARKMRAIDAETGDIGKTIVMIAKSASIPISSAEDLDFADLKEIGEALADFLSSSPLTGKKS